MPNGSGDKPAPDYNGAAQRQFDSNQQTWQQQQAANRPDQTNAFGTTSQWSQGPDGSYSQQTQLGGQLGQYASGLQGQLDGSWKPGQVMDGNAARDQAIQGAYGQATSRLDPQFRQREESQRAQLAAQGLSAGDAAFDNQMGNFGRDRNDAYTSAMASAIAQGTSAGNSAFQNNLAAHQQTTADHQLPLQGLAALNQFTGQQGFQAAGQAQGLQALPAAQAQGNYQLQQQQQDAANAGGFWGGLGSLGGAAIGFGLGGPAGGMLGQKIGSTAGGMP